MPNIQKPLPFPELESKPDLLPLVKLTDDMSQVLSLLTGYDGTQRRLLRCSAAGILQTGPPRTKGIIKVTDTGANYDYQGPDTLTNEVLLHAGKDNTGVVYLSIDKSNITDECWLLYANDWIKIAVDNLKSVYFRIVTANDVVRFIYSR